MVLGRSLPFITTKDGVRATLKGQPIDPKSVRRYLARKFGEELANVWAAMEHLAKAYPPEQLAAQAYTLYERFRSSRALFGSVTNRRGEPYNG
jgi:hypothetical protein